MKLILTSSLFLFALAANSLANNIPAIPEPGSAAVIGGALIAGAAFLRRRKK